jgi:hypothetical protein
LRFQTCHWVKNMGFSNALRLRCAKTRQFTRNELQVWGAQRDHGQPFGKGGREEILKLYQEP